MAEHVHAAVAVVLVHGEGVAREFALLPADAKAPWQRHGGPETRLAADAAVAAQGGLAQVERGVPLDGAAVGRRALKRFFLRVSFQMIASFVGGGILFLMGQEADGFGDAGYQGVHKRPDARKDVTWHVAMRPGKRTALDKDNNPVDALIPLAR